MRLRFPVSSARPAAQAAGWFAEEIVPVVVQVSNDMRIMDVDEHPRPDTTLEGLARLRPVVKADGTVTAGNASGVMTVPRP
jgi:3-oxoadipyl-CoA thiolase